MVKILKYLLAIVSVALLSFTAFLVYMTGNDYAPAAETELEVKGSPSVINVNETIRCLTWNIGYAGLDEGMDFFYDGGSQVRPTEQQCTENLNGISSYLSSQQADFFLLQEIDIEAKRSYYKNQVDTIANLLGCAPLFAQNYSVNWVPLPVTEPMGYVNSGVALYSKYVPSSAERHSYPVNFSWPLKVFMLDRCFLVARYATTNGKQLLMINTHNSAFDGDGALRKAELDYLRDFLLREYAEGNYVIVGGDFNQCPPGFLPNPNDQLFDVDDDFHTIPSELLPASWVAVYDTIPTNRRVIAPYDSSTTKHTVIDFFIVSPNVKPLSVKVDDLHFKHSDHNPVKASFVLN